MFTLVVMLCFRFISTKGIRFQFVSLRFPSDGIRFPFPAYTLYLETRCLNGSIDGVIHTANLLDLSRIH